LRSAKGRGFRGAKGDYAAAVALPFLAALSAVTICLALCGPAAADGFHNAALVTKSLDEWLADVRSAVPDIDERMEGHELTSGRDIEVLKGKGAGAKTSAKRGARRGGQILADLTPQQQALLARKGQDCLELLAYLDPKNIFPHEFPNFQLDKVPEYRQAAKKLLGAMGPEGTRQVAARVRQELMAGPQRMADVGLHPSYYDDLLKTLKEGTAAGNLSSKELRDLLEAVRGVKSGPQAGLAKSVQQALSFENLDMAALMALAADSKDSKLRMRLAALLQKKLPEAGVLELLRAQATVSDATMAREIQAELAKRSPQFKEVREQLADIWKLAGSGNDKVSKAARRQVANAFQRAPIAQCLEWLGNKDEDLRTLIWEQIDGRIDRADEATKDKYAAAALTALEDSQTDATIRAAGLDLLARLKGRRHAAGIVDQLPKLPRELWPKAGSTLRELTGQDFGPRAGDGVAEVITARNRWREWLERNSGP
jgi:hypothetical protein